MNSLIAPRAPLYSAGMKARAGHLSTAIWAALACAATGCTTAAGPPGPQTPARPPPATAPPAYAGPSPTRGTAELVLDERGESVVLEHGAAGDPAVVGCADGRREAFLDAGRYPAIAGCLGVWAGRQSLRSAPTGRACGDGLGPCAAPADLCAAGWHVCGSGGAVADLRQVSPEACEQAGGGRFVAGISHCQDQHGCTVDPRPQANYACYPTGWCSQPVCCGRDCGEFGPCRDGVWPQQTHIPFGQNQGCGSTESRRASGVLCCRG